jgi:hypothetical protein
MKHSLSLFILTVSICSTVATWANESEDIKTDMIAVQAVISEKTGLETEVIGDPVIGGLDIHVIFKEQVKKYEATLGAVIGAVAESTRKSKYRTHQCIIKAVGWDKFFRCDTKVIRQAQKMALSGDYKGSWEYFDKHAAKVPSLHYQSPGFSSSRKASTPPRSHSSRSSGPTIAHPTADKVYLATDEAAHSELIRSATSGNFTETFVALRLAGKLFLVPSPCRVSIIDQGWAKTKVRVLEGESNGQTGWIVNEWVKD